MKIQPIKFQLSKETIKHIENSTKCSIEELRTHSLTETKDLMIKRGAMKKPNRIKQLFANKYQTIGEKLGLLEKQCDFYTYID